MRALVRTEAGVALVERAVPRVGVVVEVAYAGVCRTDLAVADGTIVVSDGRVLGHELAGWVEGAPVTVIPFSGRSWLGIDRDGAFADRVAVPAACVLPLPAGMSLVHGAYVEPVAAALGALVAIRPRDRVLVTGAGRIAALTVRVIEAAGAMATRDVAAGPFDVIVEHDGAAPVAALNDGGTLVLKSRARRDVVLDAAELVARDLVVRGASHGSFATAIEWLSTRRIAIDDLLAAPRPLDAYADVFAAARGETAKQLFAIGASCAA